MKVFVHLHEIGQNDWNNRSVEMDMLPSVGEFLAFSMHDDDWWQVELVVRCYFDADYQAEVYAHRVNGQSAVHGIVAAGRN